MSFHCPNRSDRYFCHTSLVAVIHRRHYKQHWRQVLRPTQELSAGILPAECNYCINAIDTGEILRRERSSAQIAVRGIYLRKPENRAIIDVASHKDCHRHSTSFRLMYLMLLMLERILKLNYLSGELQI